MDTKRAILIKSALAVAGLAAVCGAVSSSAIQGARAGTEPFVVAAEAPPSRNLQLEARRRRSALNGVASWAIQLRFIDKGAIAAAPLDLVVIDHAPHPQFRAEIPFSRDDLAALKTKPDGGRRIVLAYLSIGEAERYRFYWRPEWDIAGQRPLWLGAENKQWPGDYAVDYASTEWQRTIFGTPDSFLDRIIDAGFDGVYLDRADAFQDGGEPTGKAEAAMTAFVSRIADHAHHRNGDFLVLMQNAEELLATQSLVDRLDGVAKEDLLFGQDNSELANPRQMVADSVSYLRKARRAGLKVFVLEYAVEPRDVEAAQILAKREGFTIHFTERMLGTLSIGSQASGPAGSANEKSN